MSSEFKVNEDELDIKDLITDKERTCIVIATDSKYYTDIVSNISKNEYYNMVFFTENEKEKIVYWYSDNVEAKAQTRGGIYKSAKYWEERYKNDGNSGSGSYNNLAEFKAKIMNLFLMEHSEIKTCCEWGCGDGNQLLYINYPQYIGTDVSETALNRCRLKFSHDKTKSFYSQNDMFDYILSNKCDLSVSLDVIFHLVEDEVFEKYMDNLFKSTKKYVCIYSSNVDTSHNFHEHHRVFTDYIEKNFSDFRLIKKIDNEYPYDINNPDKTSFSDFYFYEK